MDFQAMASADPEDIQTAVAQAQAAQKRSKKSDLAGVYSSRVATILKNLNDLEVLEWSMKAAGTFEDADLIGANAYMTADQLSAARTIIANLIVSLRDGGQIEKFSRDALEAVVPGGSTI